MADNWRARILAVNDDPMMLKLLSKILTADGHEVETAINGHDALEKIRSKRYDLILLDIHMPYMSGFEVYEHIKSMSESLARKVIFMTSYSNLQQKSVRESLTKTGVPCIPMPFDIEQLKKVIYRILTQGGELSTGRSQTDVDARDNPGWLLKQAFHAFDKKRYRYSSWLCLIAIRRNPNDYFALCQYAQSLYHLGKVNDRKAASLYKRAIGIKPDHPLAHTGLGLIHYENAKRIHKEYSMFPGGDWAMFLDEESPENENKHSLITSYADSQVGNRKIAIKELEEAANLTSDKDKKVGLLDMAAEIYCIVGSQDGIKAYEKILRIAPDNARAHFVLAGCYASTGKRELALQEYKFIMENAPEVATDLESELARFNIMPSEQDIDGVRKSRDERPQVRMEGGAYWSEDGKCIGYYHDEAVILSKKGLIRRARSRFFKPGIRGLSVRARCPSHPHTESDGAILASVADIHDDLLFFTNKGRAFCYKCCEIPSSPRAVNSLFPINEKERVTAMVAVTDFTSDTYLFMATRHAEIRKASVSRFASIGSSGITAMDLQEGDELVAALMATDNDDIIQVTRNGQSIRFNASELTDSFKSGSGVSSICLLNDDEVVSMDIVKKDVFLLVVTTVGFGKITPIVDFPRQHLGGKGIRAIRLTEKTGEVAAAKVVTKFQWIYIISDTERSLYTNDFTVQHRNTQGRRLLELYTDNSIVALVSVWLG